MAVNRGTGGPEIITSPDNLMPSGGFRRKILLPEAVKYVDAFEISFSIFVSSIRGRERTPDSKFLTHEKRPIPDTGVIAGGETYEWAGDGTKVGKSSMTFGVNSETVKWIKVHQLLKIHSIHWFAPQDPINVRVTEVNPATNFVTVVNVTTRDTLPKLQSGDKFFTMAPAYQDGSERGSAVSKDTESNFNYTQIMRHTVEQTRRMKDSTLIGPEHMMLMKRDCIRNFNRERERLYLYGERGKDLGVSGHELTYTDGFIPWFTRADTMNDNTNDAQVITTRTFSQLRYDDFGDICEKAFRYKSGPDKFMFMSRAGILGINKTRFFGESLQSVTGSDPEVQSPTSTGQFNLENSKNRYGLNIQTITSAFGNLHFVECPALESGSEYENWGLIIDPASVRERYLTEMHWNENNYNNNMALEGQELYYDAGPEWTLAENCNIVKFENALTPA
jgi:hypothetical protein